MPSTGAREPPVLALPRRGAVRVQGREVELLDRTTLEQLVDEAAH